MIGVWAARPVAHGAKCHGLAQRNEWWFIGVELPFGQSGAFLE
jgi:hypothetical protein